MHVTAFDRNRTCANAGTTALKACYGCRQRAQARFLRRSPAFVHVRSRSTAVDCRGRRPRSTAARYDRTRTLRLQ